MKQWTALLAALALMLGLTACGGKAETVPEETPAEETARREVTFQDDSGEYTADDGTVLLTWSWMEPVVSGVDGAGAINAASAERTERFLDDVETRITDAENLYDGAPELWTGDGHYAMDRTVSVSRLDDEAVSFVYEDTSYSMGAHGYTATYGAVYDARSGEELTLAALSDDEAGLRAYLRAYILNLSKTEEYTENGYSLFFDGYEAYISDVVADGLWYFDADGMVFISQPYVLGSYAAGTILFPIPYGALLGQIDDRWIPAGTEPVDTPEPVPGSETVTVTFSQMAGDSLAEDGTVLLHHDYTLAAVSGVPGADAINAALQASRDAFYDGEGGVNTWQENAGEAYANGWWMEGEPYELTQDSWAERADTAVISLCSNTYTYAQGAHGYNAVSGRVFDSRTGAEVTLAALSDDEAGLRAYLEAYILNLSKTDAYADNGYSPFFDGYEAYISDVVADGLWYFNGEGMVFIAQPYMLAPYAYGTIFFTVPYADLTGVVDSQWLL